MEFTRGSSEKTLQDFTRTGSEPHILYCLGMPPPMRLEAPAAAMTTDITDMPLTYTAGLAKIMRPAEVCSTLVTVTLIVWLIYWRPFSTTIIVPSSR